MPPEPTLKIEMECGEIVCGIDEAGRAPLAGPVVAACVCIPPENRRKRFWSAVNDSKKIPPPMREELSEQIREFSFFGVSSASHEEIDAMNIHHASLLAMRRAFHQMLKDFSVKPDFALIDGKFIISDLGCPARAVIKGDSLSRSIAAASILAKVTRDRLMQRLHEEFPVYRWNTNVGYPTPDHIRAIRDHGITEHHRRSFGQCRQAVFDFSDSDQELS